MSKSFRTKGEAQAWERDALHAIDAGEYVAPNVTTVAAVCADWLAEAESLGRLRHATLAAYRSDVNCHIIPRLGRLAIADLSPSLIESRLIVPLARDGLANTSIRGAVVPLGRALDRAVRHRLLRVNPARGIAWREVLPEDAPKAPKVTFTTDELSRLIDAAPTAEARTFLGLMAGSGLRIGEALALRRRDLGATTVEIGQAVSRGRIGPPKTAASEAVVPVLPERREHLEAARLLAAGLEPDALVFTNTRGRTHDPNTAARRWLRHALAAAGLPHASFHVFRHSYSLILAERRVSVSDTRDLMRHRDADLTVNTYQRDDGEAWAERLRRAVDG